MLVKRGWINLFMSTLQGQYYEILISSVSSNFSNMVIVGKRVEEGLKNGKIQAGSSSQVGAKKTFNNNYKNKEGETNVISSKKFKGKSPLVPPAQMSYLQYPYVAVVQYPTVQYPQVVPTQYPLQAPQNQALSYPKFNLTLIQLSWS